MKNMTLKYLNYTVCVHAKWLQSCLTSTPWTVACQVPLTMTFCRQEYWRGSSHPPPADLPDLGIKPSSLVLLHWQVVFCFCFFFFCFFLLTTNATLEAPGYTVFIHKSSRSGQIKIHTLESGTLDQMI